MSFFLFNPHWSNESKSTFPFISEDKRVKERKFHFFAILLFAPRSRLEHINLTWTKRVLVYKTNKIILWEKSTQIENIKKNSSALLMNKEREKQKSSLSNAGKNAIFASNMPYKRTIWKKFSKKNYFFNFYLIFNFVIYSVKTL